jgi:hypothetical protein
VATTPELGETKIAHLTPEEWALWESDPEAAAEQALAKSQAKRTPAERAEYEARSRQRTREGARVFFGFVAQAIRALDRSRPPHGLVRRAARPREARRAIRRVRSRSGSRGSPGRLADAGDEDPSRRYAVAPGGAA